MKHKPDIKMLRRYSCCAVFAFAFAAIPAAAQTTDAAPAQPATEAPAKASSEPAASTKPKPALPTTAEVEAKASEAPEANVVALSPFSVSGSAVSGYQAKQTLAGTRIRTNVNDIGSALQIVTPQFLQDTGATGSQGLLIYTTGTEIGGLSGNFEGNGNGQTVYEQFGSLQRPDLNTRIRGLSSADNTRDYETSDIPWDSYNVDTIELQRGANSILFGIGSPSGIVNASLKQAEFTNHGTLEDRFGSYGSFRNSLDLNRVLLKDELAIRVDLLKDDTKYEQKPAFSNNKRIFSALRYDPKFLNRGSAHTTLRVNYEKGSVDANNPRTLPPEDQITPWFQTGTTTVNGKVYNNLNKGTFDFDYNNSYFANVPGSGAQVAGSPNYQPYLGNLYSGNYVFFTNPGSGTQSGNFYVPSLYYSAQQPVIGGLSGNGLLTIATAPQAALNMGLPFAGDYKNTSLANPSIFDFYHKLIDGPEKQNNLSFEAFNAVLSQTFFNEHVGIEATYDRQHYYTTNYDPFNGSTMAISPDLNKLLPNGAPNPNLGRPYIITSSYYGGGAQQTLREDSRLTGFVKFKADDFLAKSWLTRILGQHVFTANANRNNYYFDNQGWAANGFNTLGSSADPHGVLGSALDPYRFFQAVSYLGSSMTGLTTPSGTNLSNITAFQSPSATGSVVAFDKTWNAPTVDPAAPWYNPLTQQTSTQAANPANYIGWTTLPVQTLDVSRGDAKLLTTGANQNLATVNSKSFVWQGSFLDNTVIPILGYRQDAAKAYTVTAPNTIDGIANQADPAYQLPGMPFNAVYGATKSYSVVVHTPEFIRKNLPGGLDVSLFIDKSSNFEPSAGRVDILANPISAPTGKTKDYGIVISALNDRLSLKVTHFQTEADNASFGITNLWLAGALESRAWVLAKRYQAGLTGNPAYAGRNYNYGTTVNGVFTQTAADMAAQKADSDAQLAGFDPVFWKAWNMVPSDSKWQTGAFDPWSNGLPGIYPTGMTATSDNLSKGYEFELYFSPTDNWNITANASKTTAIQSNVAGGGTGAFLQAENALFSGPAGQLRMYTGDSTATVQQQWDTYVYNGFLLDQLLDGSANSELRPWRFNFVTNYRFASGKLKGLNLGGGYLWQSRIIIGYTPIHTTINGQPVDSYDVNAPFYGPRETSVNLWIGYAHKIVSNITWHVQLNVNNALGKNELIPINVQPDGTAAAYRIMTGPTWSITNTFDF